MLTYGLEPKVTADHGDDEDFRSLLVDVRKFVMPDEPAFFYRIANELQTRLTDVALRNLSTADRSTCGRSPGGRGMPFELGTGRSSHGKGCLNIYAYGGVFHGDPAREAEWNLSTPWTKRCTERR